MTYTIQKLQHAQIIIEQVKLSQDNYPVFIANLDAFVMISRSVTFIMQKEFKTCVGFDEWHKSKQLEMSNDRDYAFFNDLRVDTTHVRPFSTPSKIVTAFPNGLTIWAGKSVEIPLGKVDDYGNLLIDNSSPITADGKHSTAEKRSTNRIYFFTKRPDEDAIELCNVYLKKLQKMVSDCYVKLKN